MSHRGATKAENLTPNGRYPGAELYDTLLARSERVEAEVERLRDELAEVHRILEDHSLSSKQIVARLRVRAKRSRPATY